MHKLLSSYLSKRVHIEDYRQRFHVDHWTKRPVYKDIIQRAMDGLPYPDFTADEIRKIESYGSRKAIDLKKGLDKEAADLDAKLKSDVQDLVDDMFRYE